MSHPQRIPGALGLIADELLIVGAVQFGAFPLKAHRTNSSLPLSPYYFNCRTVDHPSKPGLVPKELVVRIALAMHEKAAGLVGAFDVLSAVPHGATPYADALSFLYGGLPVIRLRKRENEDGTTCVDGLEPGSIGIPFRRPLPVEDVVTTAASCIEATTVFRRFGGRVTDVLSIVDRQQGGAQRLIEQGVRLHSLFTFRSLVDHYHAEREVDGKVDRQIDLKKYEESLAYHSKSQSI